MSGRQWQWIAAGTAAVAVVAAVAFNDTTSDNSFRAHPFATVERFAPEVGRPVTANPTLDATTVRPVPPPSAQAPTVTQTPPAPPPPPAPSVETQPSSKPPAEPPRGPFSIIVPTYFPDCHTAWLFGAAPIERGEPGYRRELDRDSDGIACER